jgi:hypothetical protein
MAEIEEKVAASTPSDTSIRPLDRHAGVFEPERTMTPAATKGQPPPCPIRTSLHLSPPKDRLGEAMQNDPESVLISCASRAGVFNPDIPSAFTQGRHRW